MTDLLTLQQIVEQAFENASKTPTVARWASCADLAGAAAVCLAGRGQQLMAAQMEGVAVESRRQQRALEGVCEEIAA